MPKGIRLKSEQIVAKLREIEVKIGQGKDVLTACPSLRNLTKPARKHNNSSKACLTCPL
jgi:hypothetical protein